MNINFEYVQQKWWIVMHACGGIQSHETAVNSGLFESVFDIVERAFTMHGDTANDSGEQPYNYKGIIRNRLSLSI